jgi:hypothetical protein
MNVETKCQLCHKPLIVEVIPNDFFKTATLVEMATCESCLETVNPTPPVRRVRPGQPGKPPEPPRLPYAD